MPFVQRNEFGKISGVFENHQAIFAEEFLADDDPELNQFLYPVLTFEQRVEEFTKLIQKRLDDFAKTRGYDGCLSCCTYADSEITKFAAEGQYMKAARDQHWSIGYQIISDVQAGNRDVPTLEQLFIELGELEWPN